MNNLATAIQAHSLTGTPAEIVAALAADVDLPHDHALWTYNGVANTFGPAAAEGLSAAMNAAGLTTAVMVYASRGFDLSLDLTQQQLSMIAANVPQLAEVCTALKAIGRPKQPRWQSAGLQSAPNEAAVTIALTEIAAQQARVTFFNECLNPLLADDSKTVSEIQVAVAAWGA